MKLLRWLHNLAVALDQFVYVVLAGPPYLLGLGDLPSPQQTISGAVGLLAISGNRVGLIAEWVIDNIFELLGSAPGHCRRAIVTL